MPSPLVLWLLVEMVPRRIWINLIYHSCTHKSSKKSCLALISNNNISNNLLAIVARCSPRMQSELKNVDKLQEKYRDETPIWWYTYECFLYLMLNRGLRTMDTDIIIKTGFFIND